MSRRDFYTRQESESIRLLDGTNSDDDDLRDNPFPDSPSLRKAKKRGGGALDAFLSRMGGSLAVIYFLVMAVNGALIGALGPSLEPIGRACHMNDAMLGQLILQNRICKFVGNLVWCTYANRLQHPDGGVGRPHSVFAGLMLLSASSAITLGAGEQKMAVQVALLSWGIAYGITDAGVTSLTVWRWAHDNRRRRIHVAVLNAGFTVGALIGPGLVALSLRYGGGRWAFFFIAAAALCACALLGWQPGVLLPVTQRSSGMGQGSGSRSDSDLAGYPPRFNGADERLRYEWLFTIAMSIVVYCVTSTEHGMATWLSPFGIEEGGLAEQRMAVMSAAYWGVMCAGRILWAGLSGWVSSTWPMLFFDLALCAAATFILMLSHRSEELIGGGSFEPLLWLASVMLGLGVSSGLPCVFSLPPEVQVPMTPWAIAVLNAASTAGEMSMPFIIGLAFGKHEYWAFAVLMFGCMVIALLVGIASWRLARAWSQRVKLPVVESDQFGHNPAESLQRRLPSSCSIEFQ